MAELASDNINGIGSMFDNIAGSYDFLNMFLSFGMDRLWRKKAVRSISGIHDNPRIIDVATGTGDLAIESMKLDPSGVTGIDISGKMLDIARLKITRRGFNDMITLARGDSENISFPDNAFDVAMVAFGVRNFSDPVRGLSEMCRVIKEGGVVMVLEFSKPVKFPFRQIHAFYFLKLVPLIGRLVSRDREAYNYLPESVMRFPDNQHFIDLMNLAGFSGVKQERMTFGIVSIYTGYKQKMQ
jgi:demethylmenaquinone methyltransferase/2-methoxy-6-polyprenyl-1,4-benzoquinol methylase